MAIWPDMIIRNSGAPVIRRTSRISETDENGLKITGKPGSISWIITATASMLAKSATMEPISDGGAVILVMEQVVMVIGCFSSAKAK